MRAIDGTATPHDRTGMDHRDQKGAAEQLRPEHIPPEYYDFAFYTDKERMITYWHQVVEILRQRPQRVLEVGVGNGIVSSILERYGVDSTTVDINESLRPDIVAPVTELEGRVNEGEFPFVLCARVLQHLPLAEFERALSQLHYATSAHVLLTLPVETLRFYFRFRVTGRGPVTLSLPFPLFLKRLLQGALRTEVATSTQNFWKIGQSRESSMKNVRRIIERHFHIEKAFRVPEDMSHAFFVLRKR